MNTATSNQIRSLTRKVELLAPAGKWEAFQAVLQAGADAIYLGMKRFNMRRHRSDFNFTEEQLAHALKLAHQRGTRIYVTVNAMLGQHELPGVRELLCSLAALGVDAVIVQDLATIRLAAESGLRVPLHASTMMNVHHVEHAAALKQWGVTRIITSRDISLSEAGEIGRETGLEVECFVHGDMCVAQSGQCGMSGVLFGKSANRGECMKPCRWSYDLVRLSDGEVAASLSEGHLLALKDLCLVHNIPDVVEAGICSLKIEGRMRDPLYLGSVVQLYREALDRFYACPPAFRLDSRALDEAHRLRTRQHSTLTLLGGASHRDLFDTSGRREPLFLSNGCRESADAAEPLGSAAPADASACARTVELAVCVNGIEAARAAMDAGAARIYLAAELSRLTGDAGDIRGAADLIDEVHARGIRAGIRTPRITNSREWSETRWLLRQLAAHAPDFVLVHHPGTLRLAASLCPDARIIADHGFNLLNAKAVELLAESGAAQFTVSGEAGYDDLAELAAATPLPLELLAHGPVVGMLIDHCVIALHATPAGAKDLCRGPCRYVAFGLRDQTGEIRPVIADQYCRNHLLTAHDLGILPELPSFLFAATGSLRIEAQFYSPELTGTIVRAYAGRLSGLAAGDGIVGWQERWQQVVDQSPRPLSLGAYRRSITESRSTAQVIKELVRS